VFSGGWSLEGAESICADSDGLISPQYVLPLLGRLIKKSLVLYSINNDRYDMLETIRLYAMEKLNQEAEMVAALQHRRVEYYLDFLRQHRNSFLLIESERANLISAYQACMKHNPENLAEFSNLLCDVLIARGYFRDGIFLFSSGLQAVDVQKQPEVAAILNHNLGRCYFEIADEEKAKALFNLSLSTTSDALMQAHNYLYLAAVYVDQEANEAALELIEKSRALYASLGYQKGLAEANYWEAFMNYYGEDILKVQSLLTSALDMFKKAGDGWGKLQCMHLLSYVFIAKNNPDRTKPEHLARAEQVVEGALALSESLGELNYRASLFRVSAEIAAAKGAYDEAQRRALEGLNLSSKFEDKKLQAQVQLLICRIFIEQEKFAEGIDWGNKVLHILDDMDDVRIRASVQKNFCLAQRGLKDIQAARRAGIESRELFARLNDHFQIQEVDRLLELLV
jgi:tetratricopeptide (TPR) repeat protein